MGQLDYRNRVKQELQEAGHQVYIAHDSQEAIDFIDETQRHIFCSPPSSKDVPDDPSNDSEMRMEERSLIDLIIYDNFLSDNSHLDFEERVSRFYRQIRLVMLTEQTVVTRNGSAQKIQRINGRRPLITAINSVLS